MQKALKINVFENIKDTTTTQLLLNLFTPVSCKIVRSSVILLLPLFTMLFVLNSNLYPDFIYCKYLTTNTKLTREQSQQVRRHLILGSAVIEEIKTAHQEIKGKRKGQIFT
jgi:hypothetical protein